VANSVSMLLGVCKFCLLNKISLVGSVTLTTSSCLDGDAILVVSDATDMNSVGSEPLFSSEVHFVFSAMQIYAHCEICIMSKNHIKMIRRTKILSSSTDIIYIINIISMKSVTNTHITKAIKYLQS